MSDAGFVFLLIGVAAALMASNRVRYDLVALIVVLALYLGGVLTIGQALSGFGSTVVILVACLLVVGKMLERTGVARAVGNLILHWGGANETRLLVLLMVSAAFLGSVMSSTAVVAIFIPIILRIVADTGVDRRQLLLPMSYAALISGMLTLIATTPNLVVSDELAAQGYAGLGFFSFFPIGVLILAVAIGYMLAFGRKMLRRSASEAQSGDRTDGTAMLDIWETFSAGKFVDFLEVRSALSLEETRAMSGAGLTILARERLGHDASGTPVIFRDGMELQRGDRILVKGSRDELDQLAAQSGFRHISSFQEDQKLWLEAIGLADVAVHPDASILEKPAGEALETFSDSLVPIAIIRDGVVQPNPEGHLLKTGDRILVAGPWEQIDALIEGRSEFVLLRSPMERKEIPPAKSKFGISLGILAFMVVVSALDIVSVTTAVLMAAIGAVLFRTLSAEEAYGSISLPTLVLIAGMLPLADALDQTGGSDMIVAGLLQVVGQADPRIMMGALFLLTTLLGLVLSNTASAVLVAPIAIVAAETMGVSPYPFAISVLIAASAAFSTPVSTPVVTLVVAPGGYRFVDFLKLGVPLTLIVGLVTVFVTPFFFPL